MREAALQRMAEMEEEHGVESVAYEMLGPPRLSKLLFEAAILGRLFDGNLQAAAALDAERVAADADQLLRADEDLRTRILSIGLPILLPDGERMLRGPDVKVGPETGVAVDGERLAENGWVDLRPSNWARWRGRAGSMLGALEGSSGAEAGSGRDLEPWYASRRIRPGALAAWVFREEDRGARIKR
jgi:hypothetical protein